MYVSGFLQSKAAGYNAGCLKKRVARTGKCALIFMRLVLYPVDTGIIPLILVGLFSAIRVVLTFLSGASTETTYTPRRDRPRLLLTCAYGELVARKTLTIFAFPGYSLYRQ